MARSAEASSSCCHVAIPPPPLHSSHTTVYLMPAECRDSPSLSCAKILLSHAWLGSHMQGPSVLPATATHGLTYCNRAKLHCQAQSGTSDMVVMQGMPRLTDIVRTTTQDIWVYRMCFRPA